MSLSLPFLECMSTNAAQEPRPKRFCAVYFPYGVAMKGKGEEEKWAWFPKEEGAGYNFNESLKPLEPIRDDLTVLGGLSHPNGRGIGGHDSADIWLTGALLKGTQSNTVSLDQIAAEHFGHETRFKSITLSNTGGVGSRTRASTLAFTRTGQPIPAINSPRIVYSRLFGVDKGSIEDQRSQLSNSQSMLDLVLENSKTVRGKLGKQDQEKFDEYLQSVRQIEQRVERSEQWLDVPKPSVNATGLNLDADDSTPEELMRTMYDLMFLAFQTDSTRLATYQLDNMNGATSIAGKFPQLLGFGNNSHSLAHGGGKTGGAEKLGKWDRFKAQQFSYFLQRLKDTPEGDGNLLDHTIVMYGSSNSNTHNNRNYPVVLAGGSELGLKHGQYLRYDDNTPFSNVHETILNRLEVPTNGFADSTGELKEIVA